MTLVLTGPRKLAICRMVQEKVASNSIMSTFLWDNNQTEEASTGLHREPTPQLLHHLT